VEGYGIGDNERLHTHEHEGLACRLGASKKADEAHPNWSFPHLLDADQRTNVYNCEVCVAGDGKGRLGESCLRCRCGSS
jgi:hypothetical protein